MDPYVAEISFKSLINACKQNLKYAQMGGATIYDCKNLDMKEDRLGVLKQDKDIANEVGRTFEHLEEYNNLNIEVPKLREQIKKDCNILDDSKP